MGKAHQADAGGPGQAAGGTARLPGERGVAVRTLPSRQSAGADTDERIYSGVRWRLWRKGARLGRMTEGKNRIIILVQS